MIDGYNVCIFAYGQTGSGKTYTLLGSKENPGIIGRSINEIFNLIEPLKKHSNVNVNIHMVELYMDNLIDLLTSKENKNAHLDIKEDFKGMTYIQNVTIVNIQNREDFEKNVKIGIANRKTGKTDMNDESSRSHLILTVVIEISNLDKNSVKKYLLYNFFFFF